MATYPLKNLNVGSNTYQIKGGEFYVIEVGVQGYSADDFAAFPQSTNITSSSTVTVYDKDGNVVPGFDWSKLASVPCISHIITSGSGGNIDSYAGFIGIDGNQYPTLFSASFESDWKSPSSVPTRYGVRIDILQGSIDEVRGYALQVSAGGGGGSSTYEVTLCSQSLQPVPVGQFDSSSQINDMRLVDSSSEAKSFDAIFNAWKTAEVIINIGTQYDATKRHFKVIAVDEGNSTSITAVYVQNGSPRYVIFTYSGTAWTVTKN